MVDKVPTIFVPAGGHEFGRRFSPAKHAPPRAALVVQRPIRAVGGFLGGSSPPRSGRRQCVVRRGRRRERLRVPVRPLPRLLPAFPARFRRRALASCGYSGCIARAGRGGREGALFHPNPRRRPRRVAGTPGLPVTSSGTAVVHHRNPPPREREAARAGPAPGGSDVGGNNTPSANADASPGLGGSGEKSCRARGGCTSRAHWPAAQSSEQSCGSPY